MKLMEEQNPEVPETKSISRLPGMGVSKLPLLFTVVLGFPFAMPRIVGRCNQTMHSLSPQSHLPWLYSMMVKGPSPRLSLSTHKDKKQMLLRGGCKKETPGSHYPE